MWHLDVDNDDGVGGSSIIVSKEVEFKIPKKGICTEQTMQEYVSCLRLNMKQELEKADIACNAPALAYSDFNG